MDRREFLKYTTLGALLGTELLSSLSCGDDYCGYSSSSDEAKLIRKSREAIKSGLERKKEPPYIMHEINHKKSKHPLVFQDNYIVEIHPPGTGIDKFGIFRSEGRLGAVYSICLDECEAAKKTYPECYLSRIIFVEDVQTKDWEPFSFKYNDESSLNATAKNIFNKLRNKK